jgi:hypothetical protein
MSFKFWYLNNKLVKCKQFQILCSVTFVVELAIKQYNCCYLWQKPNNMQNSKSHLEKIWSTKYCFFHAWHGHVRLTFLRNVSPSSSGWECSQFIYADVDLSDSRMRRGPRLVIHANRCLTLTNSMLQIEVSFSSEISTTQVMFKTCSEIFISYSYRFLFFSRSVTKNRKVTILW